MKIENRKTHNVIQGSKEWLELRAKHYTASEAPAMLGVSKHQSRNELLKQHATGSCEEVSSAQQALFDRGHATEEAIRPHIEQVIGEDLFPATVTAEVDGMPLLASCDGQTMIGEVLFEHKLLNQDLVAAIGAEELPEHYTVQMEQQLMVTGAGKCLFVCSDGTPENCHTLWYESDHALRKRIVQGWAQFAEDVSSYQHTEQAAPVAAEAVKDLPAVSVQVSGSIDVSDNFKVFEVALRDFIDNRLIREPQTDQDFADLDAQIKALKKAEKALNNAEEQMLSQVQSISDRKRTKDMLNNLVRDNRLMAEKLLKAEKDKRRSEIMQRGRDAMDDHIRKLDESLGVNIHMPDVPTDFAGVMKGLKTITSLINAVDTELSRAKIEANQVADKIRFNLEAMREDAKGYEFLFSDAQSLLMKENDDLKNLIAARITEHQKSENEKEERIKRQAEEDAARKVAQEQEKREAEIRAEEQHKAELERIRAIAEAEATRREQETVEEDAGVISEAEQRGAQQVIESHHRNEDIVHLLRIAVMTAPKEYAGLMQAAADEIEMLRGCK